MNKEMDILDYLKFYLDCEFYLEVNGRKYKDIVNFVTPEGCAGLDTDVCMYIDEMTEGTIFKLILTRPEDMLKEQKDKYYELCKALSVEGKLTHVDTPESLRYLFSRGIDAFDLIDNGLALDKKEVDSDILHETLKFEISQ